MADRILTPSELAELLTISTTTVDALVKDGLPAIELGSAGRRFLLSDTLEWLRSRLVVRGAPRAPEPAGTPVARVALKRGGR